MTFGAVVTLMDEECGVLRERICLYQEFLGRDENWEGAGVGGGKP